MRGGKRQGAGRKPGSVARIDRQARRAAYASGITPLDYLLGLMRDDTQNTRTRIDAAKAALPYVHQRLGPIGNEAETQQVRIVISPEDMRL